MSLTAYSLLTSGTDPSPVEVISSNHLHVLLVCEHAGQAIPATLDGLGLNPGEVDLHIGWDIGAGAVTRAMAARLDCSAVLQRYSRLVIDCNRPDWSPDAIPAVSDGVRVPGNENLSPEARAARIEEIFRPYDAAVAAACAEQPALALAIHSFTPELASRPDPRPWEIGLLFRADAATSGRLAKLINRRCPEMRVGFNEPYTVDDNSDWFIPRYGERCAIPHSLVEIRNDLIRNPAGQAEMAALLSDVVRDFLEAPC